MAESEALAQIPRETILTWVMLWPQCDDFGHHRADPRLVWAAIYPLRNDVDSGTVARDLEVLEDGGLICRYTGCDGKTYLHVVGWTEHQRVDNASKVWLPLCSEHEKDRECRQHGAACGGSTEFAATRGDSRLGRRKTEDGRRKTVHVEPNGSPSLTLSSGVNPQAVQDQEPEATSTQAKPEAKNGRNPIRGEIVQGATAGQLVGEFVDACTEIGVEPIPRDKARIGKDCKELLAAGKAAELISAAIARLVSRGRPVSALIGIVGEIERERAGHPVSNGRVNTTGGSARLERAVEAVKAERRQRA